MPVTLHAPPPLTHQDGIPPYSARRSPLQGQRGVEQKAEQEANKQRTTGLLSITPAPRPDTFPFDSTSYSNFWTRELTVPRARPPEEEEVVDHAQGQEEKIPTRSRLPPPMTTSPAASPLIEQPADSDSEGAYRRGGSADPTRCGVREEAQSADVAPTRRRIASYLNAASSSSSTDASSSSSGMDAEQPLSTHSSASSTPASSAHSKASVDAPPSTRDGAPPSPESSYQITVRGDSHRRNTASIPVHQQGPTTGHQFGAPYSLPPPQAAAAFSSIDAQPQAGSVTVPLVDLVEQQRSRIRDILAERDATTAELKALRALFENITEDYAVATSEIGDREAALQQLQTTHAATTATLDNLRAVTTRQEAYIRNFESDWSDKSRHLRAQLDGLVDERDALRRQRDEYMQETSELRRHLIQLQGAAYTTEKKHGEELRQQSVAHAKELRTALEEQAAQLEVRAAAVQHEARLVAQARSMLSTSSSAAQEDRDALQWRLSELERVVAAKEHLRGEVERMLQQQRTHVSELELANQAEIQRNSDRLLDMECLYKGQVAQEQQRTQTVQADLTAVRREVADAQSRIQEMQERHTADLRASAVAAEKTEEELRRQARQLRMELEEARSTAARQEAAALRHSRTVEVLRSAATQIEETHERLQADHSMQQQHLLRAEAAVSRLTTQLREKERESEWLRSALEQRTWVKEAQDAMRQSLAVTMGLPRTPEVLQLLAVMEGSQREMSREAVPQLSWRKGSMPAVAHPPAASLNSDCGGGGGSQRPSWSVHTRASVEDPHRAPSLMGDEGGAAAAEEGHSEDILQEADLNTLTIVEGAGTQLRSPARHRPPLPAQVETIERTVVRDGHRRHRSASASHTCSTAAPSVGAASSPIMVLRSSRSSVASPTHALPLHPASTSRLSLSVPGTPAANNSGSAAAVRPHASSVQVQFFPATGTVSDASAAEAAFAQQHTSSLRVRPSKTRHRYNVTDPFAEGAEEEEEREWSGTDSVPAHGTPAGDGRRTRSTAAVEEIFFDDPQRPHEGRRVALDAAVRAHIHRHLQASHTANQLSPSHDVLRVQERTPPLQQQQHPPSQPPALSVSVPSSRPGHHSPTVVQRSSTPPSHTPPAHGGQMKLMPAGTRATALLAQMSMQRSLRGQPIPSGGSLFSTPISSASAVLRTRAENASQLLSNSDDDDALQRYLQDAVQLALAQEKQSQRRGQTGHSLDLRGHSHYTQLVDGSSRGSTWSGGDREAGLTMMDVGSVSHPQSMLSSSRVPMQHQQRHQDAHPAASTQAAVRATDVTSATATTTTTATTAATHSPTRKSQRSRHIHDSVRQGVANTLERLSRRQQRLLHAIGSHEEGEEWREGVIIQSGLHATHMSPRITDSTPGIAAAHPPTPLPLQADSTFTTVSTLDPRQLSYSTAAMDATQGGGGQLHKTGDRQAAPWAIPHSHTSAATTTNYAEEAERKEKVETSSKSRSQHPLTAKHRQEETAGEARAEASASSTAGRNRAQAPTAASDGPSVAPTVSAVSTVSEGSSLTQLERRLSKPFSQS